MKPRPRDIQPNDILIRRRVAAFMRGHTPREMFWLHRYPDSKRIGGPWDETVARETALKLAKEDGVNVWMENGPEFDIYQLISE
jgi:hypothetical protein